MKATYEKVVSHQPHDIDDATLQNFLVDFFLATDATFLNKNCIIFTPSHSSS